MKTETLLTALALLVLCPLTLKSQMISVTGKVTDQITGNYVPQITVLEKNTGIGTLSAENGSFSLLLHPGAVKIDFFSENYELHSVAFELKKDTTFQVPVSALKADLGKKQKKEVFRSAAHGEVAQNPDPGPK